MNLICLEHHTDPLFQKIGNYDTMTQQLFKQFWSRILKLNSTTSSYSPSDPASSTLPSPPTCPSAPWETLAVLWHIWRQASSLFHLTALRPWAQCPRRPAPEPTPTCPPHPTPPPSTPTCGTGCLGMKRSQRLNPCPSSTLWASEYCLALPVPLTLAGSD